MKHKKIIFIIVQNRTKIKWNFFYPSFFVYQISTKNIIHHKECYDSDKTLRYY